MVRIVSKVLHEGEERRRLADEEPHIGQELNNAFGDVFGLCRTNDRAWRQVRTDKGAGLRHDQVGLQVLTGRSEIRKADRHASDWVNDVCQWGRVACFVLPSLKVHGFGGADADQDAQNFRMRGALRHSRIEGGATLFDRRKVETRGVRDGLQEVGIAGIGVGSGNCRVLPFEQVSDSLREDETGI